MILGGGANHHGICRDDRASCGIAVELDVICHGASAPTHSQDRPIGEYCHYDCARSEDASPCLHADAPGHENNHRPKRVGNVLSIRSISCLRAVTLLDRSDSSVTSLPIDFCVSESSFRASATSFLNASREVLSATTSCLSKRTMSALSAWSAINRLASFSRSAMRFWDARSASSHWCFALARALLRPSSSLLRDGICFLASRTYRHTASR